MDRIAGDSVQPTDLIHNDKGREIWIVTEIIEWTPTNGQKTHYAETGGAYPTPERACYYIFNWVNTGDDDPLDLNVTEKSARRWKVKIGDMIYWIERDSYRE